MRTIIAGSRGVAAIDTAFLDSLEISCILSGGARGADQLGEEYARRRGVALSLFPADWDRFGKKAGYIRNHQMAQRAERLVAFWDGASRGTKHMIDCGLAANMEVHVFCVKDEN